MWVFEEYVKEEDGKWVRPARGAQPPEGKTWVDEGYEPLTEVINRLNENVIYLPGIKLPESIIAQPDIKKCDAPRARSLLSLVHAARPHSLRAAFQDACRASAHAGRSRAQP